MTPRSRVSTAWPVTPRRRAIGSAAANTAKQANITAATSARRSASASGLPWARPASRIIAVMAPGPAISGIASGKAATLRMWSCVIATSGGVLLAVAAALEHHLEGDPEQEQPAGDAEGRQADAEK